MTFWKSAFIVLLAAPVFGADTLPPGGGLVAHEWGTFTSVAGPDGNSVGWVALSGPSDLPCFVNRIGGRNVKSVAGLVRMETPVLYFYAARRMSLSVQVDFPQGLITEWYPQAAKVVPNEAIPGGTGGRIDWNNVQLTPGEHPDFPSSQAASHYFAARNTDSTPIRIGNQPEKLLFYRGIGSFAVPLRARFTADGKLELRNASGDAIPLAIAFENHDGKLGYRIVRGLKDAATVDAPELTGDLEQLKSELADSLVEQGLYRKEALAMIETWRDWWFEEGMRVFYLMPRATVDSVLPLKITPAPESTARVFVGRVEVLSPGSEKILETALGKGDIATLRKYGRFLDAFVAQLKPALPPAAASFVAARRDQAYREATSPSCVQ
jgi:hypothetical protein